MRRSSWFLFILLACSSLLGCSQSERSTAALNDSLDVVNDTTQFEVEHNYSINYNFTVVADSIILSSEPHDSDSIVVYKGDLLVVADYLLMPHDSIDTVFVKVARDQETLGWTYESKLLDKVVPDDPISVFIYLFSNSHLLWFLLLIGVAILVYLYRMSLKKPLQIVHFNDIDSPYPTALCILIAVSATFYSSIQIFDPKEWVHFYYNPTLNPFTLPFGLACFITCVWGILILIIAVVDEVFKKLPVVDAVTYLFGLAAICVVCYIFFTFTTSYFVGYLFLVVYIWFALSRCKGIGGYQCGICGQKLPSRHSRCPHCGALNE